MLLTLRPDFRLALARSLAILTLAGPCIAAAQAVGSVQPLDDATLAAAGGDLKALYRLWIRPQFIGRTGYLPMGSDGQAVLTEGFQRICDAAKGYLHDARNTYGNDYTCKIGSDEVHATFKVTRVDGGRLLVAFDSPRLAAERAAAEAEGQRVFAERQAGNGPTGWINTVEGRFRLLRIGTPLRRTLLEVEWSDGSKVPIEDIARIEMRPDCCNFTVTRRDGATLELNHVKLHRRESARSSRTFGVGCSGLTVVVDTNARGPEVQVFSNLEGLRSIELDAEPRGGGDHPGLPQLLAAWARDTQEGRRCTGLEVGLYGRPEHFQAAPKDEQRFGTGFYVSSAGHMLTNDHVAGNCRSITVRTGAGAEAPARLVARDAANDLALIAVEGKPRAIAAFRAQPVSVGEKIYVFGFPLSGLLASEGNGTDGIVSALAGLGNDSRTLQVSAPVQPGNSGGPLYDAQGRVVGVIVSKLNAQAVQNATGDIPQNVNFAIKAALALAFLQSQGVKPGIGAAGRALDATAVFSKARAESAPIRCER